MSAEDALEFILAGASAVAVGTANFVDPAVSLKIVEGLRQYLRKMRINYFHHLVGDLRT